MYRKVVQDWIHIILFFWPLLLWVFRTIVWSPPQWGWQMSFLSLHFQPHLLGSSSSWPFLQQCHSFLLLELGLFPGLEGELPWTGRWGWRRLPWLLLTQRSPSLMLSAACSCKKKVWQKKSRRKRSQIDGSSRINTIHICKNTEPIGYMIICTRTYNVTSVGLKKDLAAVKLWLVLDRLQYLLIMLRHFCSCWQLPRDGSLIEPKFAYSPEGRMWLKDMKYLLFIM